MSLLQKNAQDVARSSSKDEGQTEEGGDDDTAVYPNVDAFQVLGSIAGGALASPSPSPRLMRCEENTQMPAIGAPSVKCWSSGVSSGFHGTTAAFESMHNNATATATAGPSTVSTIRSPFPHEDGGNEANHAAPTRPSWPRSHTVRAGAGAEDKYFDLDNFTAPLGPLPQARRRQHRPPLLDCWSDLSGEEDRATADTHSQSAPTDPSVSPTTVTIGGEAFMSVTDVPEALDRITSHARLLQVVLSSPQVLTAVQQPIEVLTRVHKDPSEEVSSSSSSPSSSFTVTELEGDCGDADGKPTTLREEAVRQLDLAYASETCEPHPVEGCKNSAASAAMRLDVSDTLLQPPTSILSEPSTTTVHTKDKSAMSYRSSGGAAANGSVGSRRVVYAAEGADASDEGAFSPVSGMDDNERASYAGMADDRNIPYADNRGAVFMQQVLSFSGTNHSLPRIWDDEDVDVDPLTTDSMRLPARALPPITFYEAYLDLTKAIRRGDAKGACEAEERTADRACSSSIVLPQAPPPVMALPTLKKAVRAAIFWCCGGSASRASTVAKQLQPSTAACSGPNRDELSGVAPVDETASAPGGPEEHLRVIRALKSQSVSLQLTTHRRMLLTVFNTLTGKIPWPSRNVNSSESTPVTSSPPSSSTAVKWESIGFQGSNPATDVRATGVLGVLQLLYLIDYYPAFAQRLWQLCRNPADEGASHSPSHNHRGGEALVAAKRGRVSNELPFVLVCFNFTALVLDAAGQHILDEEVQKTANGKRPSPTSHEAAAKTTEPAAHPSSYAGMHVCCECYVGALALFAEAWRSRPKGGPTGDGSMTKSTVPANRPSIADFGDIKARLRGKLLRKGAAKIMREAACQVRGPAEQQE
ncbi:ELMO/CED-12 family protein [Leishmania donovani]|uniref:ELMO/CED-12 family protein n=1 Tax=Leishmania donovani TaxID=5661 RepID=A0A504X1Y5_LEIDO|nr:ELMO/CED-12 family protein [Leishmania donovani]